MELEKTIEGLEKIIVLLETSAKKDKKEIAQLTHEKKGDSNQIQSLEYQNQEMTEKLNNFGYECCEECCEWFCAGDEMKEIGIYPESKYYCEKCASKLDWTEGDHDFSEPYGYLKDGAIQTYTMCGGDPSWWSYKLLIEASSQLVFICDKDGWKHQKGKMLVQRENGWLKLVDQDYKMESYWSCENGCEMLEYEVECE